ncbi:Uncharacterized protein APZ42_011706 [Daphnia magna]|uniref:Uncharacterized protein n=1 Tax=Daphnia magna TaxID=35525 RepID=A0A162SX22_9CRUS|nr:Uncharacterized protein APZ42_011706 [Daphnia magna]
MEQRSLRFPFLCVVISLYSRICAHPFLQALVGDQCQVIYHVFCTIHDSYTKSTEPQ